MMPIHASPTRRRLLSGLLGAAAGSRIPSVFAAAPPRTLKPGVLTIGTYFVNPPFEFAADGKRIGFEVDLMETVARHLGLKPKFVDTRWEVILQQQRDGLYDCIVGGITITPNREKTLAWSTPYMETTLSLIVDPAQAPELKSLADLRGKTVGVQAATTDYDAAVAMRRAGTIGEVKVYPFAEIADAVTDLEAGRIAAVMKVYPVAAWFVTQTPGVRMLAQVPNDPQPLGIGFQRGNDGLREAVNGALAAMRADGSYTKLSTHWRLE